ncbi:hypothetical protein [Pararobbsia silviterrae]|uniref:Uncharacterized protein n=1 Tax=Pararobbsia silviterrae TaxID=1792498 RepID=A0A494XZF9_9BURK|nr:hypothetical protein [Pararobbsia silviterrae]RKP55912.1 hypothetical protein D7S86_11975 [Pararobbsia silviterrae]
MHKNILIGASAMHRCEDDYAFDIETARARLAQTGSEQGLLATLLGIVGEFIASHGADDLRNFLVLLKRQLDTSTHAHASGLVAHYLDYGMADEHVSHCAYPVARMAALDMHRPASRASCVVRRVRK